MVEFVLNLERIEAIRGNWRLIMNKPLNLLPKSICSEGGDSPESGQVIPPGPAKATPPRNGTCP